MPTYHFHLENSTGPNGDAPGRELVSDEQALKEAGAAAGEVLMTELSEGHPNPHALVTVDRDGRRLAIVRAEASIERFD